MLLTIHVGGTSYFSASRIGRLRHSFHQHPLLQIAALEQLATERDPLRLRRFVRPGLTQASGFPPDVQHHEDQSFEEAFHRIEEPDSRVALFNVKILPRYRKLLGEILESVHEQVEQEQPDIFLEMRFVFISAPFSVTPFHINRENNFQLQPQGRKAANVWPHADNTVMPATTVEQFIVAHSFEKVHFKEELWVRNEEFEVRPGDGVYFPSTSPHMRRSDQGWIASGDGVSMSFGVNYYTSTTRHTPHATRHTTRVHQSNYVMIKKLKLSPAVPSETTKSFSERY